MLLDLAGPVLVDVTDRGVEAHGTGKSRLTATFAYP